MLSKIAINKCWKFGHDVACYKSCFGATQKYEFDAGVEDFTFEFEVDIVCSPCIAESCILLVLLWPGYAISSKIKVD
jgi:hypothetical protein